MVIIFPEDFNKFLLRKNLSQRTRKEYLRYLNVFGDTELSEQSANEFLDKYNASNGVVRAFIKVLQEYYKVELKKPMIIDIVKRTGRGKRKIPRVISKEEVLKILEEMKNTENPERNMMMLMVSYQAGLRITELINIRIEDLNWAEWCKNPDSLGKLRVLGKFSKERIVPVPPSLMMSLYNYVNKYSINGNLWNISTRRWQFILGQISERAIGRRVNPHLLRHSVATHFMDKGVDLQFISSFLGHSNIQSTQIYTHVSQKALENRVRNVWEEG